MSEVISSSYEHLGCEEDLDSFAPVPCILHDLSTNKRPDIHRTKSAFLKIQLSLLALASG
jgi:hypothetical protein